MRYLTTSQAAEILGVTSSRIRQLVGKGVLRDCAPAGGRDVLLDPRDVERAKGRPKRGRPKNLSATRKKKA
jgi:excisionase family DNA binding protein